MSKHPNYPPVGKRESVHHAAYPRADYGDYLAHSLFRHDKSMLLPVLNTRHNYGAYALHTLLDHSIGYPVKPHRTLMREAVGYMQELDRDALRIRQFGQVINFFIEFADESTLPHLADQANDIAHHYAQQMFIIEHGGEAWVQAMRQEKAA